MNVDRTREAVTPDAVSTEKTVRIEGLRHPAVMLQITSTADRPIIVGFEDDLPESGGLGSVEPMSETDWLSLDGGRIDGQIAVSPGETRTFTYFLIGDVADRLSEGIAIDLPVLRILHVLDVVDIYDSIAPSLRWISPEGHRLPLLTHEPADHPGVLSGTRLKGLLVDSARSLATAPYGNGKTDERAPTIDPTTAPAIGIIARWENADKVYRTVLEAQRHGLRVFLTPVSPEADEIVDVTATLGVEVVTPPEPDADRITLQETLSSAVRTAGHPGLIFQPKGCPPIDFERTLKAFDAGGFEIHAISRRTEDGFEGPHVLVGIPAYNAEETIADVVHEAAGFADEVLVVDDGSADETADRARDAGATVVVHDRNRGYGGALKTVFEVAHEREAEHLVTIDADGQHDPAEIPKLLAAQEDTGAEIVIASRYVADANTEIPFGRSIGLQIVNALTNVLIGHVRPSQWVRDTQSGLRAYTAPAVESIHGGWDIGDGMWASTDILYQANLDGLGFQEIGTSITYDVEHGSTESALTHGFNLVHNIAGILGRIHPITLLAIPGLIAVIVGLVFEVWSIRFPTGDDLWVLTAFIAALAMGVGGLTIVLAVLFHVLNTHPFFTRSR